MLSKETFIKQITILKAFFTRWNFNDKDATQMNIWYQAFSAVDDADFERIVMAYCRNNIHAPDSPNEILMILAKEEEKKYLDSNKAFNYVRDLIREYGWEYGRLDIYAAIKRQNNQALFDTVIDFEDDLRSLTVNDQFTPKRFKETYEVKLRAMCMKKRDDSLRIAATQNKLLGGALPYEE